MISFKCGSADSEEIKQLFIETFSNSEGKSEGELIGELAYNLLTTINNQDIYYFTAVDNNKVIGAIIFSKLQFENSQINSFLLSPVAVHPDYQGKGVGKSLINFGISSLREKSVNLIFTYGDIAFYSKVGFGLISEDIIKAPLKLTYPEGWLVQSLSEEEIQPISGKSYCVEPLNNPNYW